MTSAILVLVLCVLVPYFTTLAIIFRKKIIIMITYHKLRLRSSSRLDEDWKRHTTGIKR